MELSFNNISEFNKAAIEIANLLDYKSVVLLSGDLGAGKTTLVKHIINHLGGNLDEVTSPTFNIVQEYLIGNHKIYHLDLYRVENIFDLEEIGIEEILGENLVFIEWPNLIKPTIGSYHDIKIFNCKISYEKVS